MQKMYVVGLLLFVMTATTAWGAEDKPQAEKSKPQQIQKADEKISVKEQCDELEHVLQSAYDYNNQMAELGEPGR